MEISRWYWLVLTLLLAGVHAAAEACSSYGVDYSNGGAYYIDGSSDQEFSFITVFGGCTPDSISPVLVGPDNIEYACSAINTQPAGVQMTSTCGIPYSAMQSGTWRIILESSQIAVQRTITLTVGVPQTVVATVTPTVVLGITSTSPGQTVLSTITQTVTLIVLGPTVTSVCDGHTKTVTDHPPGTTVTVTSTVVRTTEEGEKTSFSTTTVSATAFCHYPSMKRDVAGAGSVAAFTSTYTETTYTVTQTILTIVPAGTTTELVLSTATATVTPAATTVCLDGGGHDVTVTVDRGEPTTITQTDLVYKTTEVWGTVWVGQTHYTTYTNPVSAIACWRAGGWFGG